VARFIQPKNRHVLYLPLSSPLVKALADYLKNERPHPSPYRHVFLGQTAPRRPLTPRTVSILIARRMRQASIPASGHQLRHASASELLRLGTPHSTLQELLGHTHISSTRVYTKIDLRQLREVADNCALRDESVFVDWLPEVWRLRSRPGNRDGPRPWSKAAMRLPAKLLSRDMPQ